MKKCRKCSIVAEHYPTSRYCKECTKAYNREHSRLPKIKEKRAVRYKKNSIDPKFIKSRSLRNFRFYHSPRGRALTLIKGMERRSKQKNQAHGVSLEHVQSGIERGYCAVTKIPFVMGKNCPKGMHPFAPSLDKIDSTKPYTDENCRIVIWAYNMMKGNMTDDALYEICLAVVRSRNGSNL